MATQYFYLEGFVNWAKVQKPALKFGSKDEYEWTLDFYPSDVKEWKATKSQGRLKEDGEGNEFIRLRRNVSGTDKDGNTIQYEPPKVLKRNSETNENEPFTNLIGNGSKVVVKVAVYDTAMGKGTRLEGLTVLDLVPYEANLGEPFESKDGETILPF